MEVRTGTPPSWLPDWYLDRQPRPAYDKPLKPRALHQSICHGLGLVDILIEALKVGQSLLKMPNPPVSNDAATRGQRRPAPREKSVDAALPSTEQPAPSPRSPRSPRSPFKKKGSKGSFASQAASRISAALGGGSQVMPRAISAAAHRNLKRVLIKTRASKRGSERTPSALSVCLTQ